ncbi:MAG TPA: DUF4494 domain-containing protein [Prolixibacteraceae bacterium]|nr:DUF4494 domain-containing protein [Prolixibacteraceae bacterium]
MNIWFECTAKYSKMGEDGREKKVSETYLLDAVSFTEAETRIYKELVSMVSGEFTVTRISKTKLAEIIPSEMGDRWYKAKVTFITFDEESGKEKRVSQFVLVFSDNVKSAYDQVIEAMKGMMADFEIGGITESPIVDVFPYIPEAQKIPDNFTKIINGDNPFEDDDSEESVEEDDLRFN